VLGDKREGGGFGQHPLRSKIMGWCVERANGTSKGYMAVVMRERQYLPCVAMGKEVGKGDNDAQRRRVMQTFRAKVTCGRRSMLT
jgi:hypothetical protein